MGERSALFVRWSFAGRWSRTLTKRTLASCVVAVLDAKASGLFLLPSATEEESAKYDFAQLIQRFVGHRTRVPVYFFVQFVSIAKF